MLWANAPDGLSGTSESLDPSWQGSDLLHLLRRGKTGPNQALLGCLLGARTISASILSMKELLVGFGYWIDRSVAIRDSKKQTPGPSKVP